MTLLGAARLIAMKDLRIELRTREITTTTALFAVLIVVLASLSFYMDRGTARNLAPGVLWIAIAFSGVLAMGRSWARERDQDAMRGLLLAPIPRASIYLGKLISTLAFILAVEVVLVPLVGVFFHLDLFDVLGRVGLLLFLGTVGFVAAGTLFAVMSVRTSARDLAISVALFPLVTPALLAGVVATREALGGAPMSSTLGWIYILLAFDLVFLFAGIVLFEPLTSD